VLMEQGADLIAENGFSGPYAGFSLSADQLAVDGASAAENQNSGFCIDPFDGTATVTNSRAENNVEDGILHIPYFCSLFVNSSGGLTQAADFTAQVSLPNGSMTISNTTANDNPANGVEIISPSLAVTVTTVTAQNNGTGILFNYGEFSGFGDLGATIALDSVVVSYAPAQIDNSLIQGNTDRGIVFEEFLFTLDSLAVSAVPTPTATIANNIICENGAGLVITETLLVAAGDIQAAQSFTSAVVADARGNWWGDDTGPTPPGSSGDTIIKGTGVVSETPWIDTFFTDAAPGPTIPNVPSNVTFRFGDAGETYFLEQGVGNLNEAPIFSISSDNGDIAAAASVDQFLKDTNLSVTVTPTTAGAVKVDVVGPCGLTPSVTIPVAEPSISVSKSPDVQGVPVGGDATFTVTVVNTGGITLTEIAVSDAIAPNCNRTAGDIADLGPGDQDAYTCALTVNNSLVNTATVTAQALVGGEPSGISIGDSDTAAVLVGSLTLTRTVWVDGFNPACQTIDKSLSMVPSGTTVKYCFTVTNTGDYTFTQHSLNDSRLGEIFGGFAHDLPPGASYSNIDAGIAATETVVADISGVTTWTGTLDGPIVEVSPASVAAAPNEAAAAVSRAIVLSQSGDDQDGDGIDDIIEGPGDVNTNGVPDFLEFTPTGEPEEDQPGLPNTLLLPNLNR